jgi:hypothetical protein
MFTFFASVTYVGITRTLLGQTYQKTTKYTKWHENIPNGHKIRQMAIIYLYQNFPLQGLPNYIKIGIFVNQIYFLATLVDTEKYLQLPTLALMDTL